jgi:DNA-binding ferritin-like protein (Dps family)
MEDIHEEVVSELETMIKSLNTNYFTLYERAIKKNIKKMVENGFTDRVIAETMLNLTNHWEFKLQDLEKVLYDIIYEFREELEDKIKKNWTQLSSSEISKDDCICGDKLKNGEIVVKHNNCGKQIHRDCLNKWINTKTFDTQDIVNIDNVNETITSTIQLANNLKCPYCRQFGKRRNKSRKNRKMSKF